MYRNFNRNWNRKWNREQKKFDYFGFFKRIELESKINIETSVKKKESEPGIWYRKVKNSEFDTNSIQNR